MRFLLFLILLPLSLAASSVEAGVAVWPEYIPGMPSCSQGGGLYASTACSGISAWASASYDGYQYFEETGLIPPTEFIGRSNVAANVEVHDVFTISGAQAGSSLRVLLNFAGQLSSGLLWYRASLGSTGGAGEIISCEDWLTGDPFLGSCSLDMPLSGPLDTIHFAFLSSLQTHTWGERQFGEATGALTSIGVYDAGGQYIEGFSMTTESGYNYASPVPEPGTALLLLPALALSATLRRHRRALPSPWRPAKRA